MIRIDRRQALTFAALAATGWAAASPPAWSQSPAAGAAAQRATPGAAGPSA